MSNPDFQFNFEFNLHKSNISIGLADDDYGRLSVAYGVSLDEMLKEVRDTEESNSREARALINAHPDAARALAGKKICFLGDSISSDRKSFCNIIRAALTGSPDIAFMDASISAYKVIDIITNLAPGVTGFAPDIAHVLIGSNDMKRTSDKYGVVMLSLDEFRKDLYYLVTKLTDMGAKVILSTIPPFDSEKVTAAYWDVNTCYDESDRAAFNAVVRDQASRSMCILNDMDDVYSRYTPDDITKTDGLHLNLLGQRLMANGVLDRLVLAAKG